MSVVSAECEPGTILGKEEERRSGFYPSPKGPYCLVGYKGNAHSDHFVGL